MSSLKLYARSGSTSAPGCAPGSCGGGVSACFGSATGRLLRLLRTARVLADAEDDELRRLHRRDANDGNQLARVHDLGRVGLVVTLHEVRLLLRPAHQGAVPPQPLEEGAHVAHDVAPE